MRAGLIVTGVLGFGVALTFGAALLAATMFPNGTSVNVSYAGASRDAEMRGGGWFIAPDGPTGNTWGPGGIGAPDQGQGQTAPGGPWPGITIDGGTGGR